MSVRHRVVLIGVLLLLGAMLAAWSSPSAPASTAGPVPATAV